MGDGCVFREGLVETLVGRNEMVFNWRLKR